MTKQSGLGGRSVDVLLALRDDIERGRYPLDSKLPTEAELCKRFDASRSTIRRAVKRLKEEGYLRSQQGSGMFVDKAVDATPGTISLMNNLDTEKLTMVQDYLLDHDYLMCMLSQHRAKWDPATERKFIERVRDERHAALLAFCSPREPYNDDVLADCVAAGVRVIHIDHYRVALPDQEYILPDYRKAGHMAAVSLMIAGYKNIIFLGTNVGVPFHELIKTGVADALKEQGFDAPDFFKIPPAVQHNQKVQDKLVKQVRASKEPVGIVVENSRLADFVDECLTDAGLTDKDFSAIGSSLIGETDSYRLPHLAFDHDYLLKNVLQTVTGASTDPLQELVPPFFIRP